MGKVGTGFSMSLDGFVGGPAGDVQRLFQWSGLHPEAVRRQKQDLLPVRLSAHPGKLRCTADTNSGSTVPGIPGAAGAGDSSSGTLPPGDPKGFDPTAGVMAIADQADDFVLACKNALAQWPKPTKPQVQE